MDVPRVSSLAAGIQAASAVLAVTDQDMVNVSVVMDAKRLNPAICTVCRLFDTNLGAHISRFLEVHSVLSASELAAPVFLSAVLQDAAIGQFDFRGLSLSIDEAGPDCSTDGAMVIAASDRDGQLMNSEEANEPSATKLCLKDMGKTAAPSRAAGPLSLARCTSVRSTCVRAMNHDDWRRGHALT